MDLVELGYGKKRHPWELSRSKTVKAILSRTSNLTNGGHVLDIGSGDGYILASIFNETNSTDITAIDIGYTNEITTELKNFRSDICWCNDYKELEGKKYDTIMMFDLLEHIDDPLEFLQSLKKNYLSDSGKIFITVPSFQSLFSNHDRFVKHKCRFNRGQLLKLISDSGLDCKGAGYYGLTLLLPRLIQVILEKYFAGNKEPHGIGAWKHGKLLTYFLEFILHVDSAICFAFQRIRCFIPGLTVWAICKGQNKD